MASHIPIGQIVLTFQKYMFLLNMLNVQILKKITFVKNNFSVMIQRLLAWPFIITGNFYKKMIMFH